MLSNVSSKAGKMLGLTPVTPRGMPGTSTPVSGTESPRPGSQFGSFAEFDKSEVTRHSIPIRCDTVVVLSTIRHVRSCAVVAVVVNVWMREIFVGYSIPAC